MGSVGVLMDLGSEDPTQPNCFNGLTPAAVVGLPMPSAGTLKNLTVASNSAASYQVTVQVYVNGVASSIGCTFVAGAGCADNANTAAVNAGDRVAVQLSNTNLLPGALAVHASLEKQ